jgi:hypothetical protein
VASTTLSHNDVLDIREDCGDTLRPPLLGYSEIQRIHDLRGGEDRDVTVVYCLRRMLAKRSLLPSTESALFDQTERLLNIWLQITGIEGGSLEVGYITLLDFNSEV